MLPGFKAPFKISAVKEFTGQGSGVVLNEEMIDCVAAVHAADGLTAHYLRAQSVRVVGLDVFDFGELNAVFVAKWQVAEKIFQSDATFG